MNNNMIWCARRNKLDDLLQLAVAHGLEAELRSGSSEGSFSLWAQNLIHFHINLSDLPVACRMCRRAAGQLFLKLKMKVRMPFVIVCSLAIELF